MNVYLRSDSFQVECPRNIAASPRTSGTCNDESTHTDGFGITLVPIETNNNIMRLFGSNSFSGFDREARVVGMKRKSSRLREYILERYLCGATRFHCVRPLWFRGETVTNQGEGVLAPNRTGDDQGGFDVPQSGRFESDVNVYLTPPTRGRCSVDGFVDHEVGIVHLQDMENSIYNMISL